MNHQQLKESLPLLFYNELNKDERILVENHLKECADYRSELEQIEKLYATLGNRPPFAPAEQLLQESRQELRAALRIERAKRSVWHRLAERWNRWVSQHGLLLGTAGAVAMLVIGVLVGRFFFTSVTLPPTQSNGEQGFDRGNVQISNIKFIDGDASDGQVEFSFDTVTPMHVRGSVNDPRIQKVLTYAMVNEQNPGLRLRAVNALSSTQQLKSPDEDTKAALILALKSDENPGVRKEAMAVLQKFPMDQQIKQAFLNVLMHDRNAGLRVAAIKSLEAARVMDQDVLNVLKDRLQSDDNDFIRLKAREALQEVKNVQ